MRKIILLFLLLAGCSTVKIDTTAPDGTACHAERQAFFMASSAIQGDACGGKVGVAGSKADSDAMAAVVGAAIAASLQGVGK